MNAGNNVPTTSGLWRYRPDIDGLRAVAVLAVILYHADLGIAGGFVGVDVFFVISGYVITGFMLAELERGRFSLAGFWERRIRRIWPAALVVTLAVLVAGYVLMMPVDYVLLAKDAMAQLGMVANIRYCQGDYRTYFAPDMNARPLLHFWSLAVEEQFYLFFPLLLVPLWRLGRLRCGVILGLLALVSLVASVVNLPTHEMGVFYLLPFRMWELLAGSLLALVSGVACRWRGGREVCASVGLALICWSCWCYSPMNLFPGLAALVPCLVW